MKHARTLSLLVLALTSCGDGTGPEAEEECITSPLPLAGSANAPVITDVGLEIQSGEGVIVVATATDPQGSENLRDVLQTVGVFPDLQCAGQPRTIQDDLVGSGIEETFGTVVSAAADPALVAAIEARTAWPVELRFSDADGNRTEGRSMARVIR